MTITPAPDPPKRIETVVLTLEGAWVTDLVVLGENDLLVGGRFFRQARIGDRTVRADPTEDPPQVHVFLAHVVDGQVQWARVFPAMDLALARSSDGIPWAVLAYERPIELGPHRYVPRGKATDVDDWKTPLDLLLWRIDPAGEPVAAMALASQRVDPWPLAGLSISPEGSPVVLAMFGVPAPPIHTGHHPAVVASFEKESARHLRSIELPEVFRPERLSIDGSGNLVVAGRAGESYSERKRVLLRISPEGRRLAQTELGDDDVLALACHPDGRAVAIVGPSHYVVMSKHSSAGETRLLEVAIDGRITASQSLGSAVDVIDLSVLPSGDVVLFGTSIENAEDWRDWIEIRGSNGERRWSRISTEASEAHAFAMESGGTIWIAAREAGQHIPFEQRKVTVRRIGTE
ncbi:hypothetical protein [Polyangium sp. 15x6]|uniref:hypothetical protein n=1 Tax=Polyangium sp. 15x6 TaxID=3042687 RepID=UPI00249C04E4|nr:hypothetical protein [Polyangium sp. 15x6]MDI3286672.1 hypothetical protein [Polyangium sp. 15x6]